jgi:hypothetical protein
MRAWVAKAGETTIYENSAALVYIALTRIERKQENDRNDW